MQPKTPLNKTGDVLASELRDRILAGTYGDGASLPTERDLVEQTGLSRGSVREALRTLQTEGLVRTRPGRHGGSTAVRPGDDVFSHHLDLFARARGVTMQTLLETREALEPMVASLAARHRTEADLVELRAITARLEAAAMVDLPAFLTENVNWHFAVSVASHNDLLRAFMASIANMIHAATQMEDLASPDVRQLVVQAHRRILQAIERGEPDAARRRMERHVTAYTQQVDSLLARKRRTPRKAGARPTRKETA